MQVWWMTINRAMGNSYLDLKYRKVIAQGWPHLGDLSFLVSYYHSYWREHRQEFEALLQLLTRPGYPNDTDKVPRALRNFHNLFGISKGDLVVAVESAQGAGQVMGICQASRNAWESYRHDDPYVFDYAQTVCFPVNWFDWDEELIDPPNPPAMIAGIQSMGIDQANRIIDLWDNAAIW